MGYFIDEQQWPRRDHFQFYRGFAKPWFNICTEVDCTGLARFCKEEEVSFFLATWWTLLKELNQVEAFRYRLRGGRVWVNDVVHLGTTYLNEDQTFSFLYMPWVDDLSAFCEGAQTVLAGHRAGGSSPFDAATDRDDLIYGSVVPWVRFTSISHAQRGDPDESVPKVVIGKRTHVGDRVRLPVSVEAHHSLVDGLHIGQLLEGFETRVSSGV